MSWGLLPRKPDMVIGRDYLRRWYILPRNRWLNIYLHHIRKSDDDRALHDHPWLNMLIVLSGGYYEVSSLPALPGSIPGYRWQWRPPGSVVFRKATSAHRLVLGGGVSRGCWRRERSCWTLFLTGPRIRNWGFYCPKGWIPWEKFVDQADPSQIGPGCGE